MSGRANQHRVPRWTKSLALDEVAAYRESGQSQRAWCAQRGISLSRLRYWLERVGSDTEESSDSRLPSMVAIQLREAAISPPMPIELEVDGRFVLRLPSGFDLEALSTVLELLSGQSSC